MHPFYQDFLDRLGELHREIDHALDGLPVDALDWSPGPEMNSLGVLIVHLTGAERYWIGDVACQQPSTRDRAAEFRTLGVDVATLKQRVAEQDAYIRQALETLKVADLEAGRVSPRDGRPFTVAWALLHALEHTALHVGQIQLTRQMWARLASPPAA